MAAWTNDELEMIDGAQELTLASVRADGSLRRPVISVLATLMKSGFNSAMAWSDA